MGLQRAVFFNLLLLLFSVQTFFSIPRSQTLSVIVFREGRKVALHSYETADNVRDLCIFTV
jgi:hypothetical protein